VTDNSWLNYPAAIPAAVSYTANALNQYTAVGAVTPGYDGNGNLTFDGTLTFGYDAENRLTSAVGAGNSAAYTYDAQGRRKTRTVNGATTVFVTDAGNREVLEYDGTSGAIQRWYAYGLGSNEVLNQINVAAATRATLVPDIQGSVIASLDSASGALSKIGYLPYGNGAGATPPFGYTGQRIDPETGGLYYYRARHYSPAWGRFLQPDPIGYAGGVNRYAYVGNDPLNRVDPTGQFGFLITFGGQAEAGLSSIFAQTGGQASVGSAILVDTSRLSFSNPAGIGISIVTFNTVGATAGALGSGGPVSTDPTDLIGTLSQGGAIAGAYAGGGVSFGITNANTAADLANLSGTASGNVGLGLGVGGQLSRSSSGTLTLSVSPPGFGVGEGVAGSIYPTNTTIMSDTSLIKQPK
jgi:RHS repeat-associated protein